MRVLLTVLPLSFALACSPAAPDRDAPPQLPAPSEYVPGEEDEGHKELRRAWIEELHRAAPGVDWRAMEARNRKDELARRAQLALTPDKDPNRLQWHEVGSADQAGRMMCGVIDPDGETLYSGSHLGGLWRSGIHGGEWTPLGDGLGAGVLEMVALPGENVGEPTVLAVMASDDILSRASEIWVSRDLGKSWEKSAGLELTSDVRMFGELDDSDHTLVACAIQDGRVTIYASTDYGRTFQQRWQDTESSQGWMWIPRELPASEDTIYVVSRGRVFRSTNGGFDFSLLSTVNSNSTACVIAGSEAGAPHLYLALQQGAQWRIHASTDGGTSFQQVNTVQGFYWDGSLCASRTDPNLVMYGGIECFRSTDGGNNFAKINGWPAYYNDPENQLHADIPGIHCWPNPDRPSEDIWYISTDGGIYESLDGGETVRNLSLRGLGVSQYYSTHTSANNPLLVVGASQDQGYQRGYVQSPQTSGPTSSMEQLISGDWGSLTSTDGGHELLYTTGPSLAMAQIGEESPSLHFVAYPPGTPKPFIPVIVADSVDPEVFYFGSRVLYRYDRTSPTMWSWTQHSPQDFTVGGGNYISAMAFAPTNTERMYAVTNGGQIFVSDDHGVVWSNAARGAPGDNFVYGQAIAVHPDNADEVVIGGSGYSSPGVIRSLDGGQTWAPIVDGLPPTVTYGLVYSPDGSGDLYAGTECGAWRWDRVLEEWENVMSNVAPITIYWSVEAVQPDIVRYGTYGRGIWDYRVSVPGSFLEYGEGKTNSLARETRLSGEGSATVSQNDFALIATDGLPNENGLILWSEDAAALPFMQGTLLVSPPVQRMTMFQFAGDGSLRYPVDVMPRMIGEMRHFQLWYRDPNQGDGTRIGLSSGVRVLFGG